MTGVLQHNGIIKENREHGYACRDGIGISNSAGFIAYASGYSRFVAQFGAETTPIGAKGGKASIKIRARRGGRNDLVTGGCRPGGAPVDGVQSTGYSNRTRAAKPVGEIAKFKVSTKL